MAFDGTEGAAIELDTAVEWTARYRATGGAIRAHFFGRDILEEILAQEDCMGIRMYYGLDKDGVSQLILVGANADEEDLYEGVIADRTHLCPPACDLQSPLSGE